MDIRDQLDHLRSDLDDCYFAACFEMASCLPIAISSTAFADQDGAISVAFGRMVDLVAEGQRKARNETVRSLLMGFKELTLETTLSTFVIILPAVGCEYAIAVGVPKNVKLGYVRLAVSRHWEALSKGLSAMS